MIHASTRGAGRRSRSQLLAALLIVAAVVAAGCTRVSLGSSQTQTPVPRADIQLVTTLITSSNDYMQNWLKGSQAFADSVGLPLKVVIANGNSQQQLSQIQAIIASGKTVVLTTNPVASADVPAIVKAVSRSGGYVVSQWNKPDDFHPVDQGPHWVAHLGYDGFAAGEYTATKLFEAMGGKGGFIALRGVLDSTADKQRYAGMLKALEKFPDVTLLGSDAAGWDRQQGFAKTQTLQAKFGDQLKGVWAGGDAMALGAYSAIQQAGRVDQVKFAGIDGITETLKLIDGGDSFAATWYTDGYYSGALGLAMAYAAATGQLDVATMTPDQREGTYRQYGVDKTNVNVYLTPPTGQQIMGQVDKGLFSRLIGPPLSSG